MSDADLLIELATLDEVEAEIPTVAEHTAGIVPPWCELRLKIKRERDDKPKKKPGPGAWPLNYDIPLRRHDGELLIEVLYSVLHPEHASAAIEGAWAALDAVVERIMKRRKKGKKPKQVDLGEARGLAQAIAFMTSPMQPNPEDIAWVATERWNIRHGRN